MIRLKIFAIFFAAAFICLTGRLAYWQLLKARELSAAARGQYQSTSTIKARRGSILASDGSWLAASGEAWTLFASLPDLSESPNKISDILAPWLVEDGGDKNSILDEAIKIKSQLERKGAIWVPLKQRVSGDIKEKIEKYEIKGIGFEPQEIRIYPEASSAAQLLGFVGKDEEGNDKGYFGLEGYYDVPLSGKPGLTSREEDATGIPILFGEAKRIEAREGVDLVTNIDKGIQLTLDKKLKEGIDRYGASAGVAIVMNPKSGAVLGMSSYPKFEPDKYWKYGNELFLNPVVSSSFEPGSIFKVVVMASALDAEVVTPDTVCNICDGPVKIDKYSIETWNNEYHPGSNMADVIVNSDNVGMVFVSKRLGKEKMYDYLKKFDIGTTSGIDLQGEFTSKLRDKDAWSDVDSATASFGQGIAVTPIQMIKAVGAIANKGVSLRPQVVSSLKGVGWEQKVNINEEKRVIDEKAASQITSMMVEAAKKGESKWTHMKGFKVAGKTGTAQIPIEGHYDEDATIASFVGFAPYDDPEFVMLITLQEPSSSPWASETAAPLWYSIARDLFIRFGIQPEN